jgi:hypothetical protein
MVKIFLSINLNHPTIQAYCLQIVSCLNLLFFRFLLVKVTVSLIWYVVSNISTLQMGTVYTPNSKEHKCEICGKTFEDAYVLSYHKSLEHSPNRRDTSGVS